MKRNFLILLLALLLSACSSEEMSLVPYLNKADKEAMTDIAEKLGLDYDSPEIVKTYERDPRTNIVYITAINISSYSSENKSEVVLSPMVGNLSHLKNLEVDCYFTENPFIPEIFNCQLDRLRLSSKRRTADGIPALKVEIPTEISKLANTLKVLQIDGFEIEELPKVLGDLKLLEKLGFRWGKLSYLKIPEEFSALTNLTVFSARDCKVQNLEPIPESFGQLPNLKAFDLHNNELSGELHSYFSVFPQGCEIDLYGNMYSEMNWDYIRNGWSMPSLKWNCLRGRIPADVQEIITMDKLLRLVRQKVGYGIEFPIKYEPALGTEENYEK